MDIASGIASIQLALDLSKGIKASKDLMNNGEVNLQIIELMEALVDAKGGLVEAKNQIVDKDKLIMELQKKLKVSSNIFDKDNSPFVWMKNKEEKDIAYCSKCYAKDGILAKVMNDRPMQNLGTHQCPVCESWFGKKKDPQSELDKAFGDVFGK